MFEHTFFIQHLKYRLAFWVLNQLDTLKIVYKLNVLPLDLFFAVFVLLHSKHMRIELVLKLLICIVNAKLFKTIALKDLKPKNI